MNPTRNKRGDLSFTIGLILSVMLIVVIAVSCTNIFKEGLSGRPGAKFKELVSAVKTLEQKPAGSSDVLVGYLGERHAIVGFSSTAASVQKYSLEGSPLQVLTIPRPFECKAGSSCLCIIENPEAVQEPFPFTQLKWTGAQCEKLTQELFNMNLIGEGADMPPKYYFKGGFLIARAAAVASDSMTKDAVGFENVPPEPQVTIEKTEHGVTLCMDQPCVRRGMADRQKLFVEANAKFAEAEKEYNAGNYAAAESQLAELVQLEEHEQNQNYGSVLNAKEHDKLYYLLAMSKVKQKKYGEALAALHAVEERSVDVDVNKSARTMLETIDCTRRSFAACTTTEPADICYRSIGDQGARGGKFYRASTQTCKQCTSETACADFDNAETCAANGCSTTCVWNDGSCAEVNA